MLSWEIHLSHQREKNPSSHLVRSMQRSEREAPVKCFFCGWKLGGLQMKRETLSGEVIHPRRVVWEIIFSFSSWFWEDHHPVYFILSCRTFRRLKVDKQVKSRAADSQAVEKIGCDTSPSRTATQLHPPKQSSESEGFFLDTGTTHVWKACPSPESFKSHYPPKFFFVFAGHRPERRFHLGLRVSWHYSSTTWPSLCSKRLWLTWESRLSKDAMKQYQQQKDTKLPEDALCFWNSFLLFGLVLVDSARACGVAKPKAGNPKMSKPWGRNRQIPNPKNPLSTHSFYWHFGIFLHFSNLRQNARKTTPNPTKSKIISKCT